MNAHWMVTILLLILFEFTHDLVECNKHAKLLYGKLLRNSGYNRIIRPVTNASEPIQVKIGLKLSQVIDVDERNQIMTTNVWVQMEWTDPSLTWKPLEYGDVNLIYVPADDIWHPDIVLYNTGDGAYEMTEGTKATLSYNGVVKWKPPATFKSSCGIDVTFFPFDEQKCEMRFGSWTYNQKEVQISHLWQEKLGLGESEELERGVDLADFYESVEWDIIAVPAKKGTHRYAGSKELFPRWTFTVHMKRKFLFYTVNLIIPLVSHALITVVVFYLPSDSKEKIALSINILLSLTVFFLMLSEIIPPTSIVVPLLGKYLVFTLLLVTFSVMVTVVTYNVHFRSSATHTMSDWTRKIFLYYLPRVLMMRRPKIENAHDVELKYIRLKLCRCFRSSSDFSHSTSPYQFGSKRTKTQSELTHLSNELEQNISFETSEFCPEVQKAIDGAIFIANHLKHEDESARTKEDWKYVALVIDRLFLWIYMAVCIFGTIGIICHAPMLYDKRTTITTKAQ